MIDTLLLLSGNDIPFPEARLIVHQPRIKEIAYITEHGFWSASQLLTFDKEKNFDDKDKVDLVNWSNFNIIMSMIEGKDKASQEAKINFISLLTLLFPFYNFRLMKDKIILQKIQNNSEQEFFQIDQDNFNRLQKIVTQIFCLEGSKADEYNPQGQLAKKIANQIRRGQQKRAQLAPNSGKKISILSRYVSILAAANYKTYNDLMEYTVYQLMDQFERFQLKLRYDTWMRYRIAGATGMEDPEDWFKDIH